MSRKNDTVTWEPYTTEDTDPANHVPMERWGKDHWSTFAYLETRVVDAKGVINNARMRCHARLHRPFVYIRMGEMMDGSAYHTRLKGNAVLERHDDWSCLEDMVAAGLLTAEWRVKRSGELFGYAEARVQLTPRGHVIAGQLRQHIAAGGRTGEFSPV